MVEFAHLWVKELSLLQQETTGEQLAHTVLKELQIRGTLANLGPLTTDSIIKELHQDPVLNFNRTQVSELTLPL